MNTASGVNFVAPDKTQCLLVGMMKTELPDVWAVNGLQDFMDWLADGDGEDNGISLGSEPWIAPVGAG